MARAGPIVAAVGVHRMGLLLDYSRLTRRSKGLSRRAIWRWLRVMSDSGRIKAAWLAEALPEPVQIAENVVQKLKFLRRA